MRLFYDDIENHLYKLLPYFLIFIFITTIAGAICSYFEYNSWKIGDWLINYQGGFVRRGLIGEVILKLSHLTDINPGIYLVIFLSSFYAIFLFFSYKLLMLQDRLLPYILLIFSPFIFTFQLYDITGGFRKEIIYFALLSFIVWIAKVEDAKKFEKIFYITLLLYPLLILTHEMLIIYIPIILIVYLYKIKLTLKKIAILALFLIPSLVALIALKLHMGTPNQIDEIFHSIQAENYPINKISLYWLDKNISFGINSVIKHLKVDNYIYYLFFIPLALIAYIPIVDRLKLLLKDRLIIFLFSLSIIFTIAISAIAVDWGRFIYIILVSIFLLSLLPNEKLTRYSNKRVSSSIIIFFLIYTLLWHIPHCCSPFIGLPHKYREVNIIAVFKPYVKIVILYFPKIKEVLK